MVLLCGYCAGQFSEFSVRKARWVRFCVLKPVEGLPYQRSCWLARREGHQGRAAPGRLGLTLCCQRRTQHHFSTYNSGKQSLAIDARRPEGRAVDPAVGGTGRRHRAELPPPGCGAPGPGLTSAQGARWPGPVYVSISGYGPDGPFIDPIRPPIPSCRRTRPDAHQPMLAERRSA